MKKVGIIVGSNRTNNRSHQIADWLAQQLKGFPFETEVIDLAQVNLPWLDEPKVPAEGDYQLPSTLAWKRVIDGLDGIIIVFPQYNWGYPAVLKNAIDTLYAEWRDKPMATVVFGSHGGGKAAKAFDLVLTGIHAQIMPINLSLNVTNDMVDDQNHFKNIDQALAPYQTDAQALGQEFEKVFG
ncbi:NAD(P)H-dependent oxidoreductase [Lactobacillaceae bacterium L1_55_11]|nr:NAD(P)H-dependent oxidoreductase [Lactobacillaceae bacterium L1_55_11]